MTIVNFTPWAALVGGALIGVAATMTWWGLGRIAGVSNILGQLLKFDPGHYGWRIAFVLGLLAAGVAAKLVLGDALPFEGLGDDWRMVVGGLLVGFGTQLGSGCTSGHGVCGISRLSPRSIVATLCFMATGGLAVYGLRVAGML